MAWTSVKTMQEIYKAVHKLRLYKSISFDIGRGKMSPKDIERVILRIESYNHERKFRAFYNQKKKLLTVWRVPSNKQMVWINNPQTDADFSLKQEYEWWILAIEKGGKELLWKRK